MFYVGDFTIYSELFEKSFSLLQLASISRVSVLSYSGLCTFLISTWLGNTVLCNNWHVSSIFNITNYNKLQGTT
jgi:hypothetical protein